jgi:methyl-accepting chemotaxis protein
MNLMEIEQRILLSVRSDDLIIKDAIESTHRYTESFKAGQLTSEEYQELLKDIQRKINIQQNITELDNLTKLNTAINVLIGLSSVFRLP